MSDVVAPFETRRLLVEFTRTPAGGTQEDRVIFTLNFLKMTSGSPDSNWTTGNYTTIESAFDTWWTTMKAHYPSWMVLVSYVWYKNGPVWAPDDLAPGPANPATRTTSRAVAGTVVTAVMPPQVAATVTLITSVRKRWGRIYLPAGDVACADVNGRFATGTTFWTHLDGALVTALNAARAATLIPVVFSRGRSSYTTVRGTLIPAHTATAYEITSVQKDNLLDVMRSRRFDGPTVRTATALT